MPRHCHNQPQNNQQIQLLTPWLHLNSPSSPERSQPLVPSLAFGAKILTPDPLHIPILHLQPPGAPTPSLSCIPDKSTDQASSAAPDAAVRQTGLAHIGPEGLQILPLPTPYPFYPPPLIPCHQHKHRIYTHMLMLAHTKFN